MLCIILFRISLNLSALCSCIKSTPSFCLSQISDCLCVYLVREKRTALIEHLTDLFEYCIYSLKIFEGLWNGEFSSFVDKIFVDCRCTALYYTVEQSFQG